MNTSQPGLGTLIDAYLCWNSLAEDTVENLAAAGLHEREDLLPALLEQLPKEAGIKTIEELETVLYDEEILSEYLRKLRAQNAALRSEGREQLPDEVDPGAIVCGFVAAQDMAFATPIARADAVAPRANEQEEVLSVDIGGRHGLALTLQRIAGVDLACIHGTVRVGHWRPAVTHAMVLAEEVSGVLMALDLLRLPPSYERDSSHRKVFRELGVSIQYDRKGDRKEQAWPLPPSVQHWISQSVLGIPRQLDDLERARLAQGTAGALENRFVLFLRPFVVGGVEASRVRRAARFLRKAATSDTPAESFLAMATALESLLIPDGGEWLEKRIAQAAAFLLGNNHPARARVRGVAEKLYEVRSRYIHLGEYIGTESKRREAMRLVADVVAHEIRMLPAAREDAGAE
jgi:hypothetical protein